LLGILLLAKATLVVEVLLLSPLLADSRKAPQSPSTGELLQAMATELSLWPSILLQLPLFPLLSLLLVSLQQLALRTHLLLLVLTL
jgi:hypothetical protein